MPFKRASHGTRLWIRNATENGTLVVRSFKHPRRVTLPMHGSIELEPCILGRTPICIKGYGSIDVTSPLFHEQERILFFKDDLSKNAEPADYDNIMAVCECPLTSRITGWRELTLISKTACHRHSRACDGSSASCMRYGAGIRVRSLTSASSSHMMHSSGLTRIPPAAKGTSCFRTYANR